ncbi:hypothetical protein RJ639_023370 [Escallonia herrerae]|uniref:Cystatin domain-containing protein n=1 Tax=Escallonia herrerae TaxID=1293975 RepID=A0AA88V080_9ASTE|nr:hypothetical protein RJ639_023370 [Escallonia herrerae]
MAADLAELPVEPDLLKKPKLSGFYSSDRAQKHYDNDSSDDEMTSDDWEKYAAQVEASDGFDVDEIRTNTIGLIHPIGYLSEMGPAVVAAVSFLSRTAMDWYNSQNGSNYVFDKLVKANIEVVAGGIYYITYEAKDAGAALATTFQARVFKGIPEMDGTPNVEVELCRIKPY